VAPPKKITVAASEFKFVLSKKSVPAGSTVIFTVINKGKIAHDFKIAGKKTKTLAKGQKTTLKVKFPKKGLFAYICTLPGHAQGGMKGKFAVGVAPPKPTTTTRTTTTTQPPPPTTTGPEPLQGDPVAGKAVFAANGCASCHTLAAAGATGTYGPNLDVAKPGQARVRLFVQNGSTSGGVSMPAFSDMSATDLNNIAAFVYASTH
jgi:mono/diheme cytochrome c family protein